MASPTLTDDQLREQFGMRIPEGVTGVVALFEPQEFGYRCPKGHGGDYLAWSEYRDHIWCFKCKRDYHYAHDCTIQRISWMTPKDFKEFLSRLPEKPKVLRGINRWMETC